MRGKPIKAEQVKVYMRVRKQHLSQSAAAEIAGFTERTGRRIESGTHQPKRGQLGGRKPNPEMNP
jgi:DNA-binding XRE family transcriptional regulator